MTLRGATTSLSIDDATERLIAETYATADQAKAKFQKAAIDASKTLEQFAKRRNDHEEDRYSRENDSLLSTIRVRLSNATLLSICGCVHGCHLALSI